MIHTVVSLNVLRRQATLTGKLLQFSFEIGLFFGNWFLSSWLINQNDVACNKYCFLFSSGGSNCRLHFFYHNYNNPAFCGLVKSY